MSKLCLRDLLQGCSKNISAIKRPCKTELPGESHSVGKNLLSDLKRSWLVSLKNTTKLLKTTLRPNISL